MKISNFQILNPAFVPALEKLLRREIPISLCAELAECISEIEKQSVIVNKVRTAIVDKYLEKDEKGKPVVIDGIKPKFKSSEAQKQFMAEVAELIKGEIEIKFNKKIDIPEDALMQPQEYLLIKDFVNITKKPTGSVDISKK